MKALMITWFVAGLVGCVAFLTILASVLRALHNIHIP